MKLCRWKEESSWRWYLKRMNSNDISHYLPPNRALYEIHILHIWRLTIWANRRNPNGFTTITCTSWSVSGMLWDDSHQKYQIAPVAVAPICGWHFCHLAPWAWFSRQFSLPHQLTKISIQFSMEIEWWETTILKSQQYYVFFIYEASVRALRSHADSWMWRLCSRREEHFAQSSRRWTHLWKKNWKGVLYKVDCNCGSTYIKRGIEWWLSDSKSTRELLETIKTTVA